MKVIKHCTGCFLLGDTQNLTECSPEQAAVADPALSSVLVQMTSGDPFQPHLFYEIFVVSF